MKLFISDFTGIGNRLEALAFAYVIRDYFGHEIVLDWPELDSFRILGARAGKQAWYDRFGCVKVRECSDELFESLGGHRNISLRGLTGGPTAMIDRASAQVAGDLRLHPRIGYSIRERFRESRGQGRPVVGVHLRRGDFGGAEAAVYDISKIRHSAVPDWWFIWAMRQVKERHPDVLFYISGTGDPASCGWLAEFDCLYLQEKSPYRYKGAGHASEANPVGDLFALASCPVILGTPASSFSHWAGNILGAPSRILMPPIVTEQVAPKMCTSEKRCLRLAEWTAVSRTGQGSVLVEPVRGIAEMGLAATDWF